MADKSPFPQLTERSGEAPDHGIPWWACSDIDRWHGHLTNETDEEAKGSHANYILLANNGTRIVVSNVEVDLILIICSHNGVTHITAFGEDGVTHYVGIIDGFHHVYTAIKHF